MKKKKPIRRPRKTFAERLAEKLEALGEIDMGVCSDKSGGWVNVRFGLRQVCFSFDGKMENIDRILITRDVIEVVDIETEQVFKRPER